MDTGLPSVYVTPAAGADTAITGGAGGGAGATIEKGLEKVAAMEG